MKSSLNDLYDYGYYIYQNDDYFKFSIDSVLLAEFVSVKMNKKTLLDICSGNAPIPMILKAKFGDKLDITGVEIQKEIYDLGFESIKYNKMDSIKFFNEDIKNYKNFIKGKKFDIITCNPPYYKVYDDKCSNDNRIKAIARHEICLDLESLFSIVRALIENMGTFYMVHRAERLADILVLANKYKFGVKQVQPVYNDRNSESCFILLEMVCNGKDYVKINKPIFLKEHTSYKNIFEG